MPKYPTSTFSTLVARYCNLTRASKHNRELTGLEIMNDTRITPGSSHRHADNTRRNQELAATARETSTVLPGILEQLPNLQPAHSEALSLDTLAPLDASECPKRTPTAIRVVNSDTLNAAIELSAAGRVAVLNMASHVNPGGGWLKGARAQEEALCYRSSLSLSLHRRYYPFKQRTGVYTRDVVVIRGDMATGHRLLVPGVSPQDLPVVSVLSVAALRNPETRRSRDGASERLVYADTASRSLTKDKMRLCLRMAARRHHGLLVLGALGCGAFKNPAGEVATCWLEVFREAEFQGGWWDEVWFAVYDTGGEGNFHVFERVLGGVEV
ncbi:mitochondrial chaperone BCS1 [Hirsutella rhossiliensis]|uniref:Mitochondrial chaperone BCS1 n=1 Tax=Hirsutella rhossiliensis TaxID=111463 RepID=A0A9P8N7G5_9HYPO|nr:mitochondrial chaperone BCS1 [Hirsutella rhossiliensis]KAH0968370.1 mitochondrial chaperone BCS1 [Hirsutella rhossiliensis]